jgi:tripartite-type tricarboxylate transporter receptor subunit TctC
MTDRFDPTRRNLIWLAAAAATCAPALALAQQQFPPRQINIVIPFAPGGPGDALGRMIAEDWQNEFGVPVIVDNKPGAASMLATRLVANGPKDGSMVLLNLSSMLTNSLLYAKPGYDPLAMVPVTQITDSGTVLIAAASLGVNNLQEYVELARRSPGKVSYGSWGVGSSAHLFGEMLSDSAQINLLHVPYKAETPAVQDLLGGSVNAAFVAPGTYRSLAGKVRALAVTGPKRNALISEVPTFLEAGVRGPEVHGWIGMFAPPGTPPEIVARMNARLVAMLARPEIRKRFSDSWGFEAVGNTPAQFAEVIREDLAIWRRTISRLKIQLD